MEIKYHKPNSLLNKQRILTIFIQDKFSADDLQIYNDLIIYDIWKTIRLNDKIKIKNHKLVQDNPLSFHLFKCKMVPPINIPSHKFVTHNKIVAPPRLPTSFQALVSIQRSSSLGEGAQSSNFIGKDPQAQTK